MKKALSAPHAEGAFRATFEDKLLLSDIVFLRTWYPLSPVSYYNPVQTHLLPWKSVWVGMKTVGQLRFEQNLPTPHNPDSEYREIERVEREFNPLTVPRALRETLPFDEKLKLKSVKKRQVEDSEQGSVVVRTKREKHVDKLMDSLSALRTEKLKKEDAKKAKKAQEFNKEKEAAAEKKRERLKITRKQDFVRESRQGGKKGKAE